MKSPRGVDSNAGKSNPAGTGTPRIATEIPSSVVRNVTLCSVEVDPSGVRAPRIASNKGVGDSETASRRREVYIPADVAPCVFVCRINSATRLRRVRERGEREEEEQECPARDRV